MASHKIVLSSNSAWSILNFRRGIIESLQQDGYEVVAVAPCDSHEGRFASLDVRFEGIEIDNQGMSPIRDLLLLWRYRNTLRRLRPDAYLGYTIKPNVYGSIAAHLCGIPVINNVAGLGTAFIRENLLTKIVVQLYKLAFQRSKVVFFQNSDDRDLFLRKGIVRVEQARLLPGSGIDLAKFAIQAPSPEPRDSFTFLLTARLLRDKGVLEYVEAARAVRKQAPKTRFCLLGPVNAPNRTALKQSDVDGWVAEGVIDYLGTTDDVRPFIQSADCIVLPSYREGLPRVLLEGAAMGKPLIATDVPGCRDVVEHGTNGYLCSVRDAGSLAEAMLKMVRLTPEARADMGIAARVTAETRFDERIPVAAYREAVKEVLTERSKPRYA